MNRCFFCDNRDTLTDLAFRSVKVQCCVTSPPYFGLRDYGHDGQLGLEKTPDEYIANLVEVFSLVWEVLADDGVLWLNLGDSYFSTIKGTGGSNPEASPMQAGTSAENKQAFSPIRISAGDSNCKPKDLIGIPWRVAFALQEAGWYLRQDIIWHKPNPMPESVKDRCTKAHEYLFLLTKQPRYYFDAEAIKEPSAQPDRKHSDWSGSATRNRRSVWTIPTKPYKGAHFAVFPPALIEPCILAGSRPGDTVLDPFFGSGTVGEVAQTHGRKWIGCEINKEYEALQQQRIGSSK